MVLLGLVTVPCNSCNMFRFWQKLHGCMTLVCCSSGDGGETMVLVGLVVVLLAVLRRRRALRALYGPPPGPLQRELSRPLPPGAHLPPCESECNSEMRLRTK